VRTAIGNRENPASSTQIIVACSSSAFFERGPALSGPLLDGLFIALAGSLYWLLSAPYGLPHQSTDMITVITHSKGSCDDLSHSARRPDIPTKPIRFGPFGEQTGNLRLLFRG
jgi:hypothetical protein